MIHCDFLQQNVIFINVSTKICLFDSFLNGILHTIIATAKFIYGEELC